MMIHIFTLYKVVFLLLLIHHAIFVFQGEQGDRGDEGDAGSSGRPVSP